MDALPASSDIDPMLTGTRQGPLRSDGELGQLPLQRSPGPLLTSRALVLGILLRWSHCHTALAHECWRTCAPQAVGLSSCGCPPHHTCASSLGMVPQKGAPGACS